MTTKFDLGGRPVHRMGYGAMQLPGPGVWGPPRDRETALAVLRRAVELGVDHIDTAQFYGPDVANELIHAALHPYPDGLTIVTKVGARRGDDASWHPAATPDELRDQVHANLRSLEVERLDLVHMRLGDEESMAGSGVPVEESLGALEELREQGKIELLGLSNVDVDTLERGLSDFELVSVQNSFGVLDRANRPVLDLCADRGLAFVSFFPLGSAFTGGPAKIAEEPALAGAAERLGATPAQVGLAWLLQTAPNLLLIPGTSSVAHLEENVAAASLELDAESIAAIDALE
jgi:pyridoxine 4-dehydrogenase